MISVKKSTSIPKKLNEETINVYLDEHRLSIDQNIPIVFYDNWRHKTVKDKVYDDQHSKCCYCEYPYERRGSDVEHFRPKSAVRENTNHPGYWWLAYSWANLFFACNNCNRWSKNDQFPLIQEGTRAFGPEDDLELEQTSVLIPTCSNLQQRFSFYIDNGNRMVFIYQTDENDQAAEETIRICDLNRPDLCRIRYKIFSNMVSSLDLWITEIVSEGDLADDARENIAQLTDPSAVFSGFIADYVSSKINL